MPTTQHKHKKRPHKVTKDFNKEQATVVPVSYWQLPIICALTLYKNLLLFNLFVGVFVSRFINSPTNTYSGLLSVGDEIIEVNGLKVQDLLLDDVYRLLSNAENLVITILPLLARTDI